LSSSTHAVPCNSLQLQSLSLGSNWYDSGAATLALLQQLPAHSLTHLECRLGRDPPAQLTALCRLTALRSLALAPLQQPKSQSAETMFDDSCSALAPLTALQQLTQLQRR
jgi:hypothetical protein